MKEKIKGSWGKFKEFYKRNYDKNKVLTIILTIIAIPILLLLLFFVGVIIFGFVLLILILWIMKIVIFGFSKKSKSSSDKVKESSGKSHCGYSEEEIFDIINTEPKLFINPYDWVVIAEALEESKYNKELKVKYAGKLPIYIFPRDQKPRMNSHLFDDSTIESGGGLFSKAKEHFTAKELKNGEICIIYQEKRLTYKDM